MTIIPSLYNLTTLQHIRSNKRSRDQVDSLPVGAQSYHNKKQRHEFTNFIQKFTHCPSCNSKLIKPITLPCGYTTCKNCVSQPTCRDPSCGRIHTLTLAPSVTIVTIQDIIHSYNSSQSLDLLKKNLSNPLECVICCTRFTQPTTTPCGHTFCHNCLLRSLDHQRSCPYCRDPLQNCPPPTQLLVGLIDELYGEDEETLDALNFEDENKVPLLIGSLSFPHVTCVIHIHEPRYRLMLRNVMSNNRRRFAMCLVRRRRSEGEAPFYEYGTMLELQNVQTLPDGRSIVEAVGSHRFRVKSSELVDGYHIANIERIDDIDREEETLMEQRQILTATASRARQQQQQHMQPQHMHPQQPQLQPQPQHMHPQQMQHQHQQQHMVSTMRPASSIQSSMVRPNVVRPGMVRPTSVRPTTARPTSVRPMSVRPAAGSSNMARPVAMVGQRRSWAQQAHPQTQPQGNRTAWSQNHVQGLSAAQAKPTPVCPPRPSTFTPSPSVHNVNTNIIPTIEKPQKNRLEQSTEELLDELAIFIDNLIQYKESNPNQVTNWLSALNNPPVYKGPQRDRVILTWWIINIIPLDEEEKLPLLGMRSVRERIQVIISWIDRFEDQWSYLFGKNREYSSSNTAAGSQLFACSIS
ncbi:carotenoid regulatory protein [Pilobolus umbonatus]|nr:carotenoid regulatory protein [Pilobolus umbonatus]